MKSFLAIVFFIVAMVGIAQQTGGGKPQFKKLDATGVDVASAVSRAEAATIFGETRKAMRAAHVGPSLAKATIPSDGKPVTRDEIIAEMTKIVEGSKKSFKFVPAFVSFDSSVLKTSSKAALSKLISWGFVAPVGPLATGPKPTISIKEFGDALGFFLARFSDLTHMPSTRWSPYLQHPDAGN